MEEQHTFSDKPYTPDEWAQRRKRDYEFELMLPYLRPLIEISRGAKQALQLFAAFIIIGAGIAAIQKLGIF